MTFDGVSVMPTTLEVCIPSETAAGVEDGPRNVHGPLRAVDVSACPVVS